MVGSHRILVRYVKCIAILITFTITTSPSGVCQDVLGFFIPGISQDRMIGGNLFTIAHGDETYPDLSEGLKNPSLSYNFNLDNLYREEQSNGIINQAGKYSRNINLSIPFQGSQFSPHIRLSYYSSNFFTNVSQDTSGSGNYTSRNDQMMISYDMRVNQLFTVGSELTELSDGDHSFVAGNSTILFNVDQSSSLSFTMGNTGTLNLIQLNITGTDGILPLHIQKRGYIISGISRHSHYNVYAKIDHSSLGAVPGVMEADNTHFIPRGSIDDISFDIVMKTNNNFDALLGGSSSVTDGSADFLSGTSLYGSFPAFRMIDREYHGGFQLRMNNTKLVTGDIQWRSLTGNIEGHIDSWPFVSIFQSLITTREYFKLNGSLEYTKLHMGTYLPLSESFTLGFGGNYMHVIPSLTVESWQPKYIIFGMRAYTEKNLSIRSLDLIIVSGGLRGRLGNFEGSYSFTQFAPIRIDRMNSQKIIAGGETSSTPSSGQSLKTSGGQFHQFTILYEF
ncbi:MAG: hypothetical protein ACHQQQ_09740 [Bacteroidota bacterium]